MSKAKTHRIMLHTQQRCLISFSITTVSGKVVQITSEYLNNPPHCNVAVMAIIMSHAEKAARLSNIKQAFGVRGIFLPLLRRHSKFPSSKMHSFFFC